MDNTKYADGFVLACKARGVNPEEIVKAAQELSAQMPARGSGMDQPKTMGNALSGLRERLLGMLGGQAAAPPPPPPPAPTTLEKFTKLMYGTDKPSLNDKHNSILSAGMALVGGPATWPGHLIGNMVNSRVRHKLHDAKTASVQRTAYIIKKASVLAAIKKAADKAPEVAAPPSKMQKFNKNVVRPIHNAMRNRLLPTGLQTRAVESTLKSHPLRKLMKTPLTPSLIGKQVGKQVGESVTNAASSTYADATNTLAKAKAAVTR